jgi:hypothetical protein
VNIFGFYFLNIYTYIKKKEVDREAAYYVLDANIIRQDKMLDID